jgi:hypothetical protein
MTLTSSAQAEYVWSLCGDVAKDLVGWQCRTSSSDATEDGQVDADKTADVWAGHDTSSCTEPATCEDANSDICPGFFNTSATECAGVATHCFPTPSSPRGTECKDVGATCAVDVRKFEVTQNTPAKPGDPPPPPTFTATTKRCDALNVGCYSPAGHVRCADCCDRDDGACKAVPAQHCTKDCAEDSTRLGCTGCTWTPGAKDDQYVHGSCTGTADTLCRRAFAAASEAASEDKQSICATGSAGTTWAPPGTTGQAIPGCKYKRKDWTNGKCANSDGTPFMSSILKQSDIDTWQGAAFVDVTETVYTGQCPTDDQATGTGSGPDDWPEGSSQSTELIYGGASGFSLTISGYVDGTGLDIKGAASTDCATAVPPRATDCTQGSDLTRRGKVYVQDAPKAKLTADQLSACPDAKACGTGAGGGLPVLFVFALMGKAPSHPIPVLALVPEPPLHRAQVSPALASPFAIGVAMFCLVPASRSGADYSRRRCVTCSGCGRRRGSKGWGV